MKRSRKSRGVSWAHGVNLCQVKLFSSEDCPSKVGLKSPDHLQARTSSMLHPYTVESNDCPPGFDVTHMGNQLTDLSCIPFIKWNYPPKFVMSCHWRVAAGEESKEVESQELRERRFLEAIYPRASAIPPCASVSTDTEDEPYNDSLTPLVPIIPIEEDECGDMESDSAAVESLSTSSMEMMASNIQLEPSIPKFSTETLPAGEKPTEKLPDVGVDVAAAASAAVVVLMKSMEQGSMIDTNLLIKIFSDPTMIPNLINILPLAKADSGSPPIATAAPMSMLKRGNRSIFLSVPNSNMIQKLPNGSLPKVSNGVPSSVTTVPQVSTIPASDVKPFSALDHPHKVNTTTPNPGNYSKIGTILGQVNIAAPMSSVRRGQLLKDLNYCKNLVRQHGDQKHGLNGNNDNHHNRNMVHEMNAENFKPKNQKHCVYFNSFKGCRNGVNCQYKHDMSHDWRIGNVMENHSAKRMKLWGGEVAGRT
ncbi:zinc finger CCCH domain-containing protein 6-like isoform X1 [Momordica charantia]|uniref:Zinc finger CCCH domain-containing protein 6-like isoform X1 n=1 Tax=Momordica charantia TaxID=3673 RepID=A0A6J1BWB6_MOMCH|nr:zinc finger CCCH domain-containing protein 6-like isoform X1 [Momordica charantia]